MIFIKPPRVRNTSTLNTFHTHAPALFPIYSVIRNAYANYLSKSADPAQIKPLGLLPHTKKLLLSLYDSGNTLKVNDKYKLNWIYELRNSDDLPYCPMCGNPGWSDLEHYLPDSHYPEFAFFSYNLIPTCTVCNRKRSNRANAPGVALKLLHPYLDNFMQNAPITTVRIIGKFDKTGTSYKMPSFELVPIVPNTDILYPRVANHLSKCFAEVHFRKWVKPLWAEWRINASDYTTVDLFREAIKKKLSSEVRLGGMNNWTAAFLRGLDNDLDVTAWIFLHRAARHLLK